LGEDKPSSIRTGTAADNLVPDRAGKAKDDQKKKTGWHAILDYLSWAGEGPAPVAMPGSGKAGAWTLRAPAARCARGSHPERAPRSHHASTIYGRCHERPGSTTFDIKTDKVETSPVLGEAGLSPMEGPRIWWQTDASG